MLVQHQELAVLLGDGLGKRTSADEISEMLHRKILIISHAIHCEYNGYICYT